LEILSGLIHITAGNAAAHWGAIVSVSGGFRSDKC